MSLHNVTISVEVCAAPGRPGNLGSRFPVTIQVDAPSPHEAAIVLGRELTEAVSLLSSRHMMREDAGRMQREEQARRGDLRDVKADNDRARDRAGSFELDATREDEPLIEDGFPPSEPPPAPPVTPEPTT